MDLVGRARFALGRDQHLGQLFERLARIDGGRTLVEQSDGGIRLTVREAASRVEKFAGAIFERAPAGSSVVIATENSYDTLLLCVAASRAGAIAVPVNQQMTEPEVEHVIADAGAGLVVRDPSELDPSSADALGRAVDANPDDVAAYFYTSGTTGKPKGAELTHRALLANAGAASVLPRGLRRDEAVVGLPVAHIMGFTVLVGLAAAGVPVYFLPRFRPDLALDAIERRRATMFVGVPAMYRMMLDAGAETRDLKSIRAWASGADVMPEELARKFQQMGALATLPGGRNVGEALFIEGYGMVEIGGGAAVKISPPSVPLPFSLGDYLGVPVPPYRFKVIGEDGSEVRAGEVGELLVKGPGVLKGYHDDPDATRAVVTDDGWLRTGDLARRGPLGLVSFAGRSKDVIKVGGYSVYAVEVQAALEEHDAVAEAAVLALPDESKGERVVAVVTLHPGSSIEPAALLGFTRERLSTYKVPSELKVVDDLPRTGTGKVKKDDLRALFAP